MIIFGWCCIVNKFDIGSQQDGYYAVLTFSFLQCFHTVDWVIGRLSHMYKSLPLIPTGAFPDTDIY